MTDIRQDYYEWLCDHIGAHGWTTHHRLIDLLYNTEFTYTIDMDRNREQDGRELRFRFGQERKIPQLVISTGLDTKPCSVLEMLIALSIRCEEDIMANSSRGNRTDTWFWHIITNLGLYSMIDKEWDSYKAKSIIQRALKRAYGPNGEGGWFYIPNAPEDLRLVEIWIQAMWYLDEQIKKEKGV